MTKKELIDSICGKFSTYSADLLHEIVTGTHMMKDEKFLRIRPGDIRTWALFKSGYVHELEEIDPLLTFCKDGSIDATEELMELSKEELQKFDDELRSFDEYAEYAESARRTFPNIFKKGKCFSKAGTFIVLTEDLCTIDKNPMGWTVNVRRFDTSFVSKLDTFKCVGYIMKDWTPIPDDRLDAELLAEKTECLTDIKMQRQLMIEKLDKKYTDTIDFFEKIRNEISELQNTEIK